MSISAEEKKRYFQETATVLQREGFRVEPSVGGRLGVWLDDYSLCEVDQSGGITYRSDNILTSEHRAAKAIATGSRSITTADLVSYELATDEAFRLIICALLLTKYGDVILNLEGKKGDIKQ